MKSLLLVGMLVFGQGAPFTRSPVDIPGRVVVGSAFLSPFPEDIRLTFVDAQEHVAAEITVSETVKTTSFRSAGKGSLYGDVRLATNGTFLLRLPPGEYRVLLRLSAGAYFVKAVEAGSTNLLEKPLVVKPAFAGEFAITLEKCTPETKDRC